jgi:PKD repeat protein
MDSIKWRLGDSMFSSVDTFTHIYHHDGTYTITAIAYSPCGIDSMTRQITLSSCIRPSIQFTQTAHGDTVHFYGSNTNQVDSVRWTLGDGAFASTDTFTHIYHHTGTYTVTAFVYGPCGKDSMTRQIIVTDTTVGIIVIDLNKTKLYPSPTAGLINLDVSGPATLGFISANGTMLWESPKQVNQAGTYVFDLSNYAAGIYYMVVQYPNGKTDVMPVIKE